MKPGWNIGKLRKGRLVRAIALLFLFHTGVDLLFPQLCSEEPVNMAVSQSLPVLNEGKDTEFFVRVAGSLPGDHSEDQRSDPPRDEDCFCCCTHVMASPGFVSPDNVELKLPFSSQQEIPILSAPPNNPYHPPRFA